MSVKVADRPPEESEEDDEDEPADEVDEQVLGDAAVRVLERHDDGVVLHEVVAPQVKLKDEWNYISLLNCKNFLEWNSQLLRGRD